MTMRHNFDRHTALTMSAGLPRILPFAVFMGFIAVEEALRWLITHNYSVVTNQQQLFLYPLKTLVTAGVLLYYRKAYTEISWSDLAKPRQLGLAVLAGIMVFSLWIQMDWSWATAGTPTGYNPTVLSDNLTQIFLLSSRVIGASIIVPVMEELFWRSWLLRYLIDQNISNVPIGTFTWVSFVIGSVLFGLEHNLWLAGIMAGAAYSLLLYRTRSLAACIFAHGITNASLAGYVLLSGNWQFW